MFAKLDLLVAASMAVTRMNPVVRIRRRSAYWLWAFLAQASSSATSLALSVLAGRALGVSGLGIVFAGFLAYIVMLSMHRALVTTPLISSSAALPAAARLSATRTALTVTIVAGVVAGASMAIGGALVGGQIGQGLLLFAPWVVPAFAHDLFRSSLYRDARARQAATTDFVWLATLICLAPLAARTDTSWAVASAWGLGSAAAALLGAAWMRAVPMSPSVAWSWFARVAFPFGRWLVLQEGFSAIVGYGLIVLLTGVIGVAGIGGLKSAQSVFAPFSLLAPALVLAGLPVVSKALAESRTSAIRLAAWISGVGVGLAVAYSAVMLVTGPRILTLVFGDAFEPYGSLVAPMCAWTIALAGGIGFTILLRAQQRGRALFVVGASAQVVTLFASTALAVAGGVEGAVWGFVVGAACGSAIICAAGFYGGSRRVTSVPESAVGRPA